MTREDIIKWLESLKAEIGKPEHRTLWHYEEAIDMAIESLQAEKCDLISRADALNEIQEFGRDVGCLTSEQIADVQRRLRKIPSAEAVTFEDAMQIRNLILFKEYLRGRRDAEGEQGEWICKGDYAVCSKCGGSSGTQFDGVEPIPRITTYCPYCGVRMTKGGAE